jgi:predicted unusual protein kinase regulating ubiquinone biosynthesis (AarF/ABC1/UbiB family)
MRTILTPFTVKTKRSWCVSQVELVDFGATRSYSAAFIDNWLRLLAAAAQQDREECVRWSLELGYLTGEEDDVSLSLSTICPPFCELTDWEIN